MEVLINSLNVLPSGKRNNFSNVLGSLGLLMSLYLAYKDLSLFAFEFLPTTSISLCSKFVLFDLCSWGHESIVLPLTLAFLVHYF